MPTTANQSASSERDAGVDLDTLSNIEFQALMDELEGTPLPLNPTQPLAFYSSPPNRLLLRGGRDGHCHESKSQLNKLGNVCKKVWASMSVLRVLVVISALANIILLSGDAWLSYEQSHRRMPWKGLKPAYNPMDEAVRYENKVLPGITERTTYTGPPNDDVDWHWDDLYVPYGISLVNKDQMERLAKPTAPAPDDPNQFMLAMHIMHQLHCLNFLRLLAFPQRYSGVDPARDVVVDGGPVDHVDHCLNAIREIIQCSADVTPNVFRWNDITKQSEARYDTVHSCRDFGAIQDWARAHNMPNPKHTENMNNSRTDHDSRGKRAGGGGHHHH